AVIALVARYHRGREPRRKHRAYWALPREARERVRRLSALLRVADGLDRGHVSAVECVKVRSFARAIRITPVARKASLPLRLELWGASRKSGLLADVARRPVEFVGPDGAVHSTDE